MKWVAFPLGLLLAGTIAWQRARDGGAWLALALGGTAGAVAGGLPFTLAQTVRWYGHPFEPLAALGNRTTGVTSALVSVARFAISLFDFGWLTRQWWPGRGGWGATFGAPLLWAMGVAAAHWSSPDRAARRGRWPRSTGRRSPRSTPMPTSHTAWCWRPDCCSSRSRRSTATATTHALAAPWSLAVALAYRRADRTELR